MSSIDTRPLQSRVARRLFGVFVLCALVPFVATASYALMEIGRVSESADSARLGYAAKSYELELGGKLALADQIFQPISAETAPTSEALIERIRRRPLFTGRVRVFDASEVRLNGAPGLQGERLAAVLAGGAALLVPRSDLKGSAAPDVNHGSGVWIARRSRDSDGIVMAELSVTSLWGTVDEFADSSSLAVFLAPATLLATSSGETPKGLMQAFGTSLSRRPADEGSRALAVIDLVGEDFRYRSFDYPLARSFQAPALRVVAWESAPAAAAVFSTRQLVFPALMLAGVLLAAWLAVRQLQRQLRPLDRLIAATRRIAARRATSTPWCGSTPTTSSVNSARPSPAWSRH